MNDQRAYFDEEAHHYPTPVHPPLAQRLELQYLERALGSVPGKHIVDFGAGSGRVTFWFLKQGYNVTAVDISKKSLANLTKTYKCYRSSSWGHLTTSTRLPAKLYDAIVGADILHHVGLQTYLPKLYRILKPGGKIAFSEPNAWFLPWYAYIFLRRLPWSIEQGILHMTASGIKRECAKAGFQNIRISSFPRFIWFRLIVSAQKTKRRTRPSAPAHP